MNMRAGALREIGDLASARAQSEEGLELAKDSGFPPAAISARLDLLYADLLEGEVGAVEGAIPGLTEALETAKGFHQFLWSIRLQAARAEASRLAGHHEDAISFARTALTAAEGFGRRKYDCLVRVPLAHSLVATGRPEEAVDVVGHAIVEAERLGHLPSRWLALSALAEARTALGDVERAWRRSGASRSSPRDWGTPIERPCASVPTS
jgi:tetratricopeptide (TPR) repeat protein